MQTRPKKVPRKLTSGAITEETGRKHAAAAEHKAREESEAVINHIKELKQKLIEVGAKATELTTRYPHSESSILVHSTLLLALAVTTVKTDPTNLKAEEKRLVDILKRHDLWEAIVLKNYSSQQWTSPSFNSHPYVRIKHIQPTQKQEFCNALDRHIAYWKKIASNMPEIEEKIEITKQLNILEQNWKECDRDSSSSLVAIVPLLTQFDNDMYVKYNELLGRIYIADKHAQLMAEASECLARWNRIATTTRQWTRKDAVNTLTTKLTKAISAGVGNEHNILEAIKKFNTSDMSRIARDIPEPSQKAKDLSKILGNEIKKLETQVQVAYAMQVRKKINVNTMHQMSALKATQSYLENEISRSDLATALQECGMNKTKSRFGFSGRDPIRSLIDQACKIKGDNLSALLKNESQKEKAQSRTPSPKRS